MDDSTQSLDSYNKAVLLLKTQGIIAIIMALVNVLIGYGIYSLISTYSRTAGSNNEGISPYPVINAIIISLILLPNIYLIVSGILLLRSPAPKLARVLTITNIVIGAMINFAVLIFAIISMVKSSDYERGYNVV